MKYTAILFSLIVIFKFFKHVHSTTDVRDYILSSGTYRAETVEILNKTVHKLTGVPYANTPLAFKKSEFLKWSHSLNITDRGKSVKWPGMCIQTLLFDFELYGNFRLPHEVFTKSF